MKFSGSVGSPDWVGFFLRIPLGAYMFLAALTKIDKMDAFIETVKGFGIVKSEFANITIGFLFPWIELFVSILLIIGLWVNLACVLGIILLAAIIVAIGPLPDGVPFNKDVILLVNLVALMFSGPGRFSLDSARQT